jgi:hypothetical protein
MLQLMLPNKRQGIVIGLVTGGLIIFLALSGARLWDLLGILQVDSVGMTRMTAREVLGRYESVLNRIVSVVRRNGMIPQDELLELSKAGFLSARYDGVTGRLTIEYARCDSLAGRSSRCLEWRTLADGRRHTPPGSDDKNSGRLERLDDNWWAIVR